MEYSAPISFHVSTSRLNFSGFFVLHGDTHLRVFGVEWELVWGKLFFF